jgi:hypothetical protein
MKPFIDKLLARQQLRTKTTNSNSWFIEIKKMLIKYNLQDPEYYLDNPMTKRLWIILLISVDDEHLIFNSGCIFPGR